MWLQVAVQADESLAEALSEALMDAGALSVSIDDADAGTEAEVPQFGEPGHPAQPLWQHNRVIALFDRDVELAVALVMGLAFAALISSFVEDRKSTRLNSSHNGQSRMPSSA